MELKKDNINKALTALSQLGMVLAPSVIDGVKKFTPYTPEVKVDLDMVNTTLPPKDALFPQAQKM